MDSVIRPTDDAAATPERTRGCRDVDAAVRDLQGVTARDVHRAAAETAAASAVPDEYDRSVFELAGLDCRTCAGFIEAALTRLEGVSNAKASHRYGSVRVDYDPDRRSADGLRAELADLGYPVETTDEAFANRRAKQWADARYAAGVMAGLMVLAPYAGVIYPTRFDAWFYDPAVVALLESALTSIFATHFYLNIAVLSGIVLFFTGKPILSEAVAGVRAGSPDRSLAIGGLAVGLFLYSSVTAFWTTVDGGVYFDVVVAVIVAATIARQAGVDAPESTAEPTRETEPELATDGGRE